MTFLNIINEDTCTCIMNNMRPEGKLLARAVSLVSSLRFLCSAMAIVLSTLLMKNEIIADSSKLECVCAVVYSTDSPSFIILIGKVSD